MLPSTYDASEYSFVLNDTGPFRLFMVSEALTKEATSRPTEPLWHIEAADKRSLEALKRWVRMRRPLWPQWGRTAERHGRAALARQLDDLLQAEPPAHAVAIFMTTENGSNEISLGEVLDNGRALQRQVFYRHRFASSEARDAFQHWWLANNPEANGWAMLEVALSRGTALLGQALDKIATEEAMA